MTTYIEMVGVETTSVNRTFNTANQLASSSDGSETTNYYLVQTTALSMGPTVYSYDYDQRNLLTNVTTQVGRSPTRPLADYLYDGMTNRVQQVNHSGDKPITTTYTNDNTGLSQVLVSDDGETQTHNLFGLSLIQQDDGSQTRTLLADGLGSVRVEMVGDAIDSATTYEPYGKLLARTGTSGTVYGFTGEQHDGVTGLLYLRACYYSPALRVFLSVDKHPGNTQRPSTLHKYNYVSGNPINKRD
jgi:RHS repeat-associated protein